MKNKILSLLFIVIFTNIALAQTYSGGDGTEGNPFQITNLTDLQYLSEHSSDWGLHFIQTEDIDASATSTWNSGSGFSPIGTYIDYYNTTPFTSSYDGDGHIITGLYINRSTTDGVAMFGYTEGANIENLGLVNVSVVGYEYVSALVGRTGSATTINNCFSTGAISSGSYYGGVGGLIGHHSGLSIENSYSRASITGTRSGGTRSLGGLIGSSYFSSVTNCYSTGAISGGVEGYIGGLIGYSYATESNNFWDTETSGQETSAAGIGKTTAEMQDASLYVIAGWDFMDEAINGTDNIWGINSTENNAYPFLAWQGYANEAELLLSTQHVTDISTLSLSATANGSIYTLGVPAPEQHGVCWNTTGSPTLSDDYTEEGIPTVGSFTSEMTGLTIHEVYYVRAYATNSNGTVYGDEASFALTGAVAPSIGTGTSSSPYEIANLENLLWISETQSEWAAGKYFIQTNDIDASATMHLDEGKGFSPIGLYDWGNWSVSFQGSYDGQGYSIEGLYINRSEHNYEGLFGFLFDYATVKNLGVTNANINCKGGAALVGAVYSSNVIISNCYATGTVTSINEYTGGLVGLLAYGTINNCYSNSVVVGNVYIGALVGQVYNGEIYNSYAAGSVTQPASSGYMTSAGGFAGAIRSATVNNCYSTALVIDANEVGGFVAYFDDATVSNCFWDTETSGQATSEAGTGKTTAEMQSVCTYLDAGWDFADENLNGTDELWTINSSDNSSYPALAWQGFLNDHVAPSESVTNISLSNIDYYSMDFDGFTVPTNGADGYVIFINHENDNWTIPVDGVEPNPIVGDYDGSGSDCIYYGTSNTPALSLTGLSSDKTYYFRVYAYNNACEKIFWEKTGTIEFAQTLRNRPVANATISPDNIEVGQTVTFDGSTSSHPIPERTIVQYKWDLDNDGEFDDASGVVYSGILDPALPIGIPVTIRLQVIDDIGLSDIFSTTIIQYPRDPVAQGRANPNPAECGQQVTFDANASYHPNPARSIAQYEWDVDGVGGFEGGGSIFRFTYNEFGTYTVTLRVTDDLGRTDEDTFDLEMIDNTPPVPDKSVLDDITDNCSVESLTPPTATDPCRLTSIVGVTDATLPITQSTTIEWTYTDLSDNITTQNQEIIISHEGPTETVTNISFSDVIYNSMVFDGFDAPTNGADGYAIYINHENSNWTIPVDGTVPTPIVGDYGGTGSECIYVGSSELPGITLNGLHPNITYYFKVYAFNCINQGYWEKTGAIASETTLKKELTISGSFTVDNKTYDGTSDAIMVSNNLVLDGVVGDDVVSLDNIVVTFASADVANGITVNIVSAELTGDNADNYTLSLSGAPTILADITNKALTLTANNASKVYGDTDPVFSVTYDGFIVGEDKSALSGTLSIDRALGEEVNTYAITPSGLTSNNYDISFVDGILTITLKELTIGGSFTVQDKEYDGTTDATIEDNSLTLITPITGDDVSILSTVAEFNDAEIGKDKTVNISEIALDGSDKDNYSLSLVGAPTTTANITETVGIEEDLLSNIEVYPNPFSDYVTITNASKISRLVVTNISGQKLMEVELNGLETETIQTDKLPHGIYLVSFYTKSGELVIRKMIKE